MYLCTTHKLFRIDAAEAKCQLSSFFNFQPGAKNAISFMVENHEANFAKGGVETQEILQRVKKKRLPWASFHPNKDGKYVL